VDSPEYRPFPDQGRRNFLQRRVEVPLFTRMLGLPKGSRLLEVGCGRGVALPVFARLLEPSLVVGLDIELEFLREAWVATRHLPSVRLVQADLRRLPFPDASFDLVIDFGTCYHVSQGERALSEIARVLVPGGVFATESKLAQLLAHPIRTRGRRLRIPGGGALQRDRHAGLWRSFKKRSR
jgi:ubiquinone/menaquinone biosynthesis C-methylase UbiE